MNYIFICNRRENKNGGIVLEKAYPPFLLIEDQAEILRSIIVFSLPLTNPGRSEIKVRGLLA